MSLSAAPALFWSLLAIWPFSHVMPRGTTSYHLQSRGSASAAGLSDCSNQLMAKTASGLGVCLCPLSRNPVVTVLSIDLGVSRGDVERQFPWTMATAFGLARKVSPSY
mmetsp:Transcript_89054/g.177175  ORF Transcript_89054/g.177175 Transcript_89054/m.177175 type:complete len:108 (+) Transcript_89054:2126-2449(+)